MCQSSPTAEVWAQMALDGSSSNRGALSHDGFPYKTILCMKNASLLGAGFQAGTVMNSWQTRGFFICREVFCTEQDIASHTPACCLRLAQDRCASSPAAGGKLGLTLSTGSFFYCIRANAVPRYSRAQSPKCCFKAVLLSLCALGRLCAQRTSKRLWFGGWRESMASVLQGHSGSVVGRQWLTVVLTPVRTTRSSLPCPSKDCVIPIAIVFPPSPHTPFMWGKRYLP